MSHHGSPTGPPAKRRRLESESAAPLEDEDLRRINVLRCLGADMPTAANSGHPGAPMGCAPMAYLLWTRHMHYNPQNPKWLGRDRFVLSNGHACALQYAVLHLTGYNVALDDLKKFRQVGSKTPGHPENFVTDGIEVTTGPLGQGFAQAVGLAIAEAHLAAQFNRPGFEVFNNYTYVIMGDGCHQEGVTSEAASLAGHLRLNRMIVLYDDNHITIDGETELSFTEDVNKRFEAYGWNTITVDNGDSDFAALDRAISAAKQSDRPTLIKVRTTIGFGSKAQGTESVHGAPLKADDLAQVKQKFNLDPTKAFQIPDDVLAYYRKAVTKGAERERRWKEMFAAYAAQHPDLASEITRRFSGALPANYRAALPRYTPEMPAAATRKFSEEVLNKLAPVVPEIIGGSADLTPSTLTWMKCTSDFQSDTPAGRYLRYGVREHGMCAIVNGLAAYGGLIPFGATFFNFVGYALGAVRLSALSHFRCFYVMTHDSIGLGEDGPTHQPIEALASVRAMPNMLVLRPADGNEVSGAYAVALENNRRPTTLVLSRQNLPNLPNTSIEGVFKGAYVIADAENPQLVLVATGSEVSLCMEARAKLANVRVRVVSMPSMELFEEQTAEYRRSVFPQNVPVFSVEAGSTFGWHKYAHAHHGMTTFGASGPVKDVLKFFGFTADNIAEKALKVFTHFQGRPVPDLLDRVAF